eukprot:CAMPEP_0170486384 /NCGR_PEP_ID=MMETSP0208-20121228/5425_1 /TAXON_ID=197538 /ORGANISM="Strombidium inclinatum, Strain S3" /LENGTH=62 /DNA_ID=CAMNT_0010760319 /DNA_START=595 /DNA_END=783 /DNA_ORIENTATION=-
MAMNWVDKLAADEAFALQVEESPKKWLAISKQMADSAQSISLSPESTVAESKLVAEFLAGIN